MNLLRSLISAACVLAAAGAWAKPIAFAHGSTVMVEYGAGTMKEAQLFHAPEYFWSLGGGYLELDSDLSGRGREIVYFRANYLVKRWNLESAQGNAFVWGGAGGARDNAFEGAHFAWNAGAQLDYETRRIYASLKTDLHASSVFTNRIDTLQLGVAPYEHDYESLATWLVVCVGAQQAAHALRQPASGRRRTLPFEGKRSLFTLGLHAFQRWLAQPGRMVWHFPDWEAPNWSTQLYAHHARAFVFTLR